jgi:hypothetical protein
MAGLMQRLGFAPFQKKPMGHMLMGMGMEIVFYFKTRRKIL